MSSTIRLEPLGALLRAEAGTPLRDLLFPYGVEFPCGGKGRCERCRVGVLEGSLGGGDDAMAGHESAGPRYRLACRAWVAGDAVLEIGSWTSDILSDYRHVEFRPRRGSAVVIDAGTTTLAAQLLNLETGAVLGSRTALNPQAVYGADIMSRVQHALEPAGAAALRTAIATICGDMAGDLAAGRELESVTLAGNTVMMHLFAGRDVTPLSRAPFEPEHAGLQEFAAGELGWKLAGDPPVRFLPCPGGFVGSDLLCGIVATGMDSREELTVLADLGTNGEVAAGNRERILCASTAAGPAFEGGGISCGMRAATGAIAAVSLDDGGGMRCSVIGGGAARGVCGSGLVDAVAAGLDAGLISASGRMTGPLRLSGGVSLTQGDIRQVQLAKGAVAAGLRVLLSRLGAQPGEVTRFYLAGAFGNYINRSSARRTGMVEYPEELVETAGNTALLGLKMAVFAGAAADFGPLLARIGHVPLGADAEFQDRFVDSLLFPEKH
jgi:uncharacterized 2Fe-2S/4Fe-4S cluster protein (DUF4445 family)